MNYHDRTTDDWAIRMLCGVPSENDDALMGLIVASIHGRDMDADIEEYD